METKRRKVISCDFCRRRKIKCDRAYPCNSCTKFKKHCSYSSTDVSNNPVNGYSINGFSPDNVPQTAPEGTGPPSLTFSSMTASSEESASIERLSANLDGANAENEQEDSDGLFGQLSVLSERIESLEKTLSMDPFAPDMDEVADSDDEINLFEDQDASFEHDEPTTRSYGPLSWMGTIKFDSVLSQIWKQRNFDFDQGNATSLDELFGIETSVIVDDKLFREFNPRCQQSESVEQFKQFGNAFVETQREIDPNRMNNLINRSNSSEKQGFIAKVAYILPKRKILWILLDHFFNHMYGLFPLLDEWDFTEKVIHLLGTDNKDMFRVIDLEIRAKTDFITLGQLLIILRLAYFSISLNDLGLQTTDNHTGHDPGRIQINNKDLPEIYQELNATFSHSNSALYFEYAQVCLNQFNLFGNITKPVFQLLLMVREYQIYGPEYGDGCDEGEAQVMNSIVLQAAYSIGLHKDPRMEQQKQNNLSKVLWYNSCITDYYTFLILGESNNLSKFYYNTELPKDYGDGVYNTINPTVERTCIKMASHITIVLRRINEIYQLFNGNQSFKINKLAVFIDRLFLLSRKQKWLFNKLVNETNDATSLSFYKTFNLKFFIFLAYFSVAISFYFYNHLIRIGKPEKAMSHLTKIFDIVYKHILPTITGLSTQEANFQKIFKITIFPIFICFLQKALAINVSVLVRLNGVSESGTLRMLLLKSNKIYLQFLEAMSGRYYFAWKALKIHQYLVNNINLGFSDRNSGFTVNNIRILESTISSGIDEFEVGQAFSQMDYNNFNQFVPLEPKEDMPLDAAMFKTPPGSKPESVPVENDDYWLMVYRMKNDIGSDYGMGDYFEDMVAFK